MKKILSFLLAACFMFSTFAGVLAENDQKPLLGQTIILHTNDSHGRAVPDGKSIMGFTAVAAMKHKYEDMGATVLVLDAGDTLHGMPFAQLSEGRAIVEIMNAVGYDAMTTGNHDYNYGYQRLLELSKITKFPVIASNVVYENTGEPLFIPNTVIEKNGVKFGIFGLATPDTKDKVLSSYVAGVEFLDPIEVAKEQVADLKKQGVNYIIALGHIGDDSASSSVISSEIVNAVDGIDIFVDGHSHSALENGNLVKDTLIVQTGYYMSNIGIVTIDKENKKRAELVNLREFSDTDEAVDTIVKKLDDEISEIMNEVVAKTDVQLDGEYENIRTRETNLGDLITDAMRFNTGADIAIVNSGGIRASIDIGDITRGEIITVLPFGNYGVTKYVKGSDIHDILEISLSKLPETYGEFLQVSGISFIYDKAAPAGQRVDIKNISVGSEKIDPNKEYLLVTNDFIAYGTNYTMIAEKPAVCEFTTFDVMLSEYIVKLGSLKSYATTDGRIVEKTNQPNPPDTGADSILSFAIAVLLVGVCGFILVLKRKNRA
ncbi:MAG: bifunctional UDP-sugar hydrolase/5'-nucleotidase [Clostridia bacterium]